MHIPLTIFLFFVLHLPSLAQITYSEHIAPIITQHCISCHRPGDISPMPLTSYEEVSAYGTMIAYVTREGLMPPWKAEVSYGHFRDENVLTPESIQTIQQWVETGMEHGDPLDENEIAATPAIARRAPDLTLAMSESFEQYGVYFDQYQVFVLPTGLDEDVYVEAIEFLPGNRDIVRHCVIAVSTSGTDSLDAWDPRYGYNSFGGFGTIPDENAWYSWTAGQENIEDVSLILPKHSRLFMYMHYGPTGVPQKDSSSINLWFGDEEPEVLSRSVPLVNPYTLTNPPFRIEPGDRKNFHAQFRVPYDLTIQAIYPQSQLISRGWEVFARRPNGSIEKLLRIADWDFDWRRNYVFNAPIYVEAGTEVHAIVAYDNTLDNPHNPADEPIPIEWGKDLFKDLLLMHFIIEEACEHGDSIRFYLRPFAKSVTGDSLKLEFYTEKTALYTCEIVDFSGHTVHTIVNKKIFTPGMHSLLVSLSRLAFGNYFIRLRQDNTDAEHRQMFVFFDKQHGM